MAYFLDLFSPETYEAFSKSKRDTSGFRPRQENMAKRIKPGDKLICYMTRLSRWIGILEVQSECFTDSKPIFYPTNDPFVIRFKVKPLSWLPKEKCIPIREDKVWKVLSFTKGTERNSSQWTGKFRNSLNPIDEKDGQFLEKLILEQSTGGVNYEIDEDEYEKYTTNKIHRLDKIISVSVPKDIEQEIPTRPAQEEVRESIKIQALIANIGAQMGLKIWLPRSDRNAVLGEWKSDSPPLLDILPLNYDETTIKTIEQIDVLWLRG